MITHFSELAKGTIYRREGLSTSVTNRRHWVKINGKHALMMTNFHMQVVGAVVYVHPEAWCQTAGWSDAPWV